MNEREKTIKAAESFYLKRYPRRWTVKREGLDMADFALIRQRELKDRIARELREAHSPVLHYEYKTQCAVCDYIEKLEQELEIHYERSFSIANSRMADAKGGL